jgi:hypothetical protein
LSRAYLTLSSSKKGKIQVVSNEGSDIIPEFATVGAVSRIVIKSYKDELADLLNVPMSPDVHTVVEQTAKDVEALETTFTKLEEGWSGWGSMPSKPAEPAPAPPAAKAPTPEPAPQPEAPVPPAATITPEQGEVLAQEAVKTAEKIEDAVKVISFKLRLQEAGYRIMDVLKSIRKLRTASIGSVEIYNFLSGLTWKKVAVALGIGGGLLGWMIALVRKPSVPQDPKANTPSPIEEESGFMDFLVKVGVAAGALAGGYYFLKKGVPVIKDWWAKRKPLSVPQAAGAAGLSGLPRRRKHKKSPTRRYKRRKTYPGPGKNFMEMQ